MDDPARRAALLVALGEAQHHAGDAVHLQTLPDGARLALAIGDAGLAARAALANQRTITLALKVDEERVTLLEDVLDALGPSDSCDRARVLVALATELHHSTDPRRRDAAHEAVAIARRLADATCLGQVLGGAVFALWEPGTLPERLEIATELHDLARGSGDPLLEIWRIDGLR